MSWSRSRNHCVNCLSDERKHVGRGLCTKCHPPTLKKEKAECWRLDDPASLRGYPFKKEHRIPNDQFECFKRNVIQHYQDRLDYLQSRGAKLSGDVDGLDLEYAFDYIARLAGSKKRNLFHGLCRWFEMVFTPEQMRALLGIADRIEKDVERDINRRTLLRECE